MNEMPFAPIQPSDGDLVAHCGHEGRHHAFRFAEPVELQEPARCDDPDCPNSVSWYVCCDECMPMAMSGSFLIASHASWKGDEPEFRLPRENMN